MDFYSFANWVSKWKKLAVRPNKDFSLPFYQTRAKLIPNLPPHSSKYIAQFDEKRHFCFVGKKVQITNIQFRFPSITGRGPKGKTPIQKLLRKSCRRRGYSSILVSFSKVMSFGMDSILFVLKRESSRQIFRGFWTKLRLILVLNYVAVYQVL